MAIILVTIFMNCKKPNDKYNLKEGINITIFAFNNGIKYKKDFTLVDEKSASSIKSWIDNLNPDDGTALFYTIDNALDEINKAIVPSNLNSVSVVTFTDGIDNASVGFNGKYNNRAQYQEAIKKRISGEKFHDFQLQAFGIGVPSADVGNQMEEFNKAIRDISSSNENTFVLNNFQDVQAKFVQIANSIHSYNTTLDVTFKISFGGTDDICLVFDGMHYNESQCKIYAKVNSDRSFSYIEYTGLTSSSGSTVQGLNPDGALYHYTFSNIKKTDGATLSDFEIKEAMLYRSSLGWGIDSEFNPVSASNTTIIKKTAAIALVIDISNSLGANLSIVKEGAKSFIDILASNHNSGNTDITHWRKKADFAGGNRVYAVGFAIGDRGYVGLGYDNSSKRDFWEYNPTSNTWTKKADFPGETRLDAVGFSIGNNGYVGLGSSKKDFWQYNPYANTWTQMADFEGEARVSAVGFSIGNKGYVGLGSSKRDFWEYDPTSNTWAPKANFEGEARNYAIGFSIANKGYVGLGSSKRDFWEYNPNSNAWTQMADFTGGSRENAVGFAIGYKGFVGLGYYNKDFWEYNPTTNTWTQKEDFEGGKRESAVGFSIRNKGYVGLGSGNSTHYEDFWEFTP